MVLIEKPAQTRTRQRYTSQACVECQRRKRKCSGSMPCDSCLNTPAECVYNLNRGSKYRRSRNAPAGAPNLDYNDTGVNQRNRTIRVLSPLTSNHECDQAVPMQSNLQSSSEPVTAWTNRVQSLESDFDTVRRQVAGLARHESSGHGRGPVATSNTNHVGVFSPLSPPTSTFSSVDSTRREGLETSSRLVGRNSFFEQIDLLDSSMVRDLGVTDGEMMMHPGARENNQAPDSTLPPAVAKDHLEQILEQTRTTDTDLLYRSLDLYFAYVNPHWPYLNEANTRSQSAVFLTNGSSGMSKSMAIQFAALLNFIRAVTCILFEEQARGDHLPGWANFRRGDKLLSYDTGSENILKIQTLLVKASYYFYASSFDAAHDTVGTAVRICFQLGLHNEPAWGKDCSFFDHTYRQRLFWALYCLSHIVAQNTGVPTLIRDSDFIVNSPRCIDDRMLYPGCPQLPELPKSSPIVYFLQVIKWAKLASEVWQTLFGIKERKPVSQAVINSLDEKIMAMEAKTPETLCWTSNCDKTEDNTIPEFLREQSFILYLRVRALRLLLRRQEMISLRYERETAELCIQIANEITDAVDVSVSSRSSKRTPLYTWALHLTGVIIPMISVIIRLKNEELVRPAIDLYHRSLGTLNSIESELPFARRILQQLNRPVSVAREVINSRWPQYARPTSSGNPEVTSNHAAQSPPLPTAVQTFGYDFGSQMGMWNLQQDQPMDAEALPSQDYVFLEDFDIWNQMSNLHA